MNILEKNITDQLNDLIEKNFDAEKGFKKASDHTDHPALKVYFNKKSIQRNQFLNALRFQVKTLGASPETSGSFKGNLHHSWMDVKALFTSENDEAMLEEAIRGEKACLEEYNEILKNDQLPNKIRQTIEDQKNQIETGLNTIYKLEDLA